MAMMEYMTTKKDELVGWPSADIPFVSYFHPEPWGVYVTVCSFGAAIPTYFDFAALSFQLPAKCSAPESAAFASSTSR
jgi:hypothetical protein